MKYLLICQTKIIVPRIADFEYSPLTSVHFRILRDTLQGYHFIGYRYHSSTNVGKKEHSTSTTGDRSETLEMKGFLESHL